MARARLRPTQATVGRPTLRPSTFFMAWSRRSNRTLLAITKPVRRTVEAHVVTADDYDLLNGAVAFAQDAPHGRLVFGLVMRPVANDIALSHTGLDRPRHESLRRSLLAAIRRLCRLLEFRVRLVEQLLGFLGMTAQIPFVGALRFADLVERLLDQPLRCCQ